MKDPRFEKLSRVLVEYSTRIQPGENVLLDLFDVPDEFGVSLIRVVREAGGIPMVDIRRSIINRELVRDTNEQHAELVRETELFRMQKMQAYIAVRGTHNISESSDVPSEKQALYSKTIRPVMDHRVNETKWCVLRWPNASMAQSANMSTEAFEDFFFQVCTMDYAKMAAASKPLEERMAKAGDVHITAPGTDLRFSIKDMGAISCQGDRNIPDGECFSCPIKDSVNGTLQYNTPTIYAGTKFENVKLTFKDGRIIEATANNTKRLNEILDTDEGARFIGEFSLGFNPHIKDPMCDILFDEKIAGSLHFTPGQAYEECDNGNRSAVHWDMVLIQRPEWGGGEVHFDGELIRKDGLFVPEELQPLNPDQLVGAE